MDGLEPIYVDGITDIYDLGSTIGVLYYRLMPGQIRAPALYLVHPKSLEAATFCRRLAIMEWCVSVH